MSEHTSAKELVMAMVNGLNNHEIEEMTQYWSEDMHWYGPAGIGTKPSLKAFQKEHQKPFLHAFPDKTAHDQVYVAEGDYVATFGYQEATHDGDWLGIPASGKHVKVRYMDVWRAENGKLVENWVLIDILGFLEQLGYDIANVLKFIGSKPPEFFDYLDNEEEEQNE
jgi:predicted ester cyclase